MKLIVQYSAQYNIHGFLLYLLKCVKDVINDLVDENRLKIYDNYVSRLYNKNVEYKKILQSIDTKLQIRKISDGYEIGINMNAKVDGTTIPVEPLCRLLNFGNQDLPPYPVIESALNYISNEINSYYILYKMNRRV